MGTNFVHQQPRDHLTAMNLSTAAANAMNITFGTTNEVGNPLGDQPIASNNATFNSTTNNITSSSVGWISFGSKESVNTSLKDHSVAGSSGSSGKTPENNKKQEDLKLVTNYTPAPVVIYPNFSAATTGRDTPRTPAKQMHEQNKQIMSSTPKHPNYAYQQQFDSSIQQQTVPFQHPQVARGEGPQYAPQQQLLPTAHTGINSAAPQGSIFAMPYPIFDTLQGTSLNSSGNTAVVEQSFDASFHRSFAPVNTPNQQRVLTQPTLLPEQSFQYQTTDFDPAASVKFKLC